VSIPDASTLEGALSRVARQHLGALGDQEKRQLL